MGDVIPLPTKGTPTTTGKARCLNCSHEWEAVADLGVDWLECPSCLLIRGTYIYPFVPSDPIWECNCGNDLLFVTEKYVFCPKCGTNQRF